MSSILAYAFFLGVTRARPTIMVKSENQIQTDGLSPKMSIPQNTPVKVTTYPTWLEKTDPKSATDKTNIV